MCLLNIQFELLARLPRQNSGDVRIANMRVANGICPTEVSFIAAMLISLKSCYASEINCPLSMKS